MYQINIGNKILYYPGSEDAIILDTDHNEEIGLAGEFSFSVPPTNPAYTELIKGALVTIFKNGSEFWRGEIKDVKSDFYNIAKVYVLEDLAWLGEEFLSPTKITDQSFAQRLQTVIASYNSARPADRQFTAGYITNVNSASNCNWATEYEWSILDSLRNCICGDTGYIRVRRITSGGTVTRYIDIVRLEDYGVAASQPVEFGYNLLDYVKDSDFGNLTNVLTPYGAELENQEVYEDYGRRLEGTTIANNDSINLYGRHAKAVVFDDITTLNQLNARAQSYLTRYCQPQITMEIQAVDLAEIENVDSFRLGDSIRVIAKPFSIDQRLYLTQIKRDIQNPDKNAITLSGNVVRRGLTNQMIKALDAIEEIPLESDILKAAKKNALNMLLDETQGGYVVFEYDSSNSKMIAINICDQPTIAASTKRWRWSQNGFGYMKRSQPGTATSPAWTELEVAIDMLGNITGNAITTGTINTARLNISGIVNGINNGSTTINGGKITTDSITASQIQAGAVNTSELAASAVTAGKIAAGAISTEKLAANAVTAGKINVSTLSAIAANMGTLTAGEITGGIIKGTTEIIADDAKITVVNGGYIQHKSSSGASYQWQFDLGAKYCNCMYYENGDWHWVNGGATEIYKYLEGAYSSDRRIKKNIKDIDIDFSKRLIMNTRPRSYRMKYDDSLIRYGVIAQEVKETLDSIGTKEKTAIVRVPEDDKEQWAVEYKQYIPHLINVVKSQQAEIELLKEEIQALKERSNNG